MPRPSQTPSLRWTRRNPSLKGKAPDLLTGLNVSLPGVHSHPCHPPPTKGKALHRELYAFYLGLSRSSGGNPARNTRDSSGITS